MPTDVTFDILPAHGFVADSTRIFVRWPGQPLRWCYPWTVIWMAERALLVQRKQSGGYGVYQSRWGGTDRALSAACSGVAPSTLGVNWTEDRHVDQFVDAVVGLDYLGVEVLYREHSRQTVFLSLWFGLPLVTTDCCLQAGTVVEVGSLQDARRLRATFRKFKCELAETLEDGEIPAPFVLFVFRGWVHCLDGRERYAVWHTESSCDILYSVNRPPDL